MYLEKNCLPSNGMRNVAFKGPAKCHVNRIKHGTTLYEEHVIQIHEYKVRRTQYIAYTHKKKNTSRYSWLKKNLLPCIDVSSVNFVTFPCQNRCDPRLIWLLKCWRWLSIVELDIYLIYTKMKSQTAWKLLLETIM